MVKKVDRNGAKPKEIDLALHSILCEATSAHMIQMILDGNRSFSRVHTWSIINGWFDDNGVHNMAVERAIDFMDPLLLTSDNRDEQ